MKTKPTKTLFLALALSAAGPAQAALCQLDDVKVTGVGIFDGTTAGAALIPIPLNTLPVGAAALWVLGQLSVLGPALRAAAVPPAVATRTA